MRCLLLLIVRLLLSVVALGLAALVLVVSATSLTLREVRVVVLAATSVVLLEPVAAVVAACGLVLLLLQLPLVVFVRAALLRSFLVFLVLFVIKRALVALVLVFAFFIPRKPALFWVVVFQRVGVLPDVFLGAHLILVGPDLCNFVQDRDQAVRIEGSVMLLAESEWALLPIGHLFALADALLENLLRHLCQTDLRCHANLGVVGLQVDEVGEVFEEVHPRQVPAEHF